MTSIRWKPQTTYRSPTASTSALHLEVPPAGSHASSSSHSPSPQSLPLQSLPQWTIHQSSQSKRYKRWMMGPSLPLYHPLGRLALSLPDLDPTAFGLPAPAVIMDDPTRRSSNRTRRPAPKVRDANEPAPSPAPLIDVAPVPEPEIKDKPSSRRRRPAGSGSKRKRREVDDGDATYPAKRSRNPRNSAANSTTRTPTGGEPSPPYSVDNSAPSPADHDGPEEKRPERRTAKSRGLPARRDSTASEATVTSVSASIVVTNGKDVGDDAVDTDASPSRSPQDAESAAPSGGLSSKDASSDGGDKTANNVSG
ncbi:uncharacterized protein EDB91DRAFT_1220301 [Suillus paluster]|uniref:uncharacterized protein n=1 Tax=Suillus paluster TaxID=48578 RepID=UPI001B883DE8|nr:uncharacterized protein EDB91DRAFT_1220301 [Suillus paluster]KAG1745359.1 hypothetical protein EDB91DRAFT_1220301 [Suillus paluster]